MPLAQSVMYSFYKIAPGGAKEFVGLRLYEKVLTDSTFWTAVGNTVQLLLFSVPTTVILALAVALGLNRIANLRWRNVWAIDVLPALRDFAGGCRAHLAMDLRPGLRLPQLRAVVRRHPTAEVAAEPGRGATGHRRRERLGAHRLRHDDLPGRAAIDPGGVLRGGRHRRRQCRRSDCDTSRCRCSTRRSSWSAFSSSYSISRSSIRCTRRHRADRRARARPSSCCCTTPPSNSSASATPP